MVEMSDYPEGFQRVSAALAERGHLHTPRWLEVAARKDGTILGLRATIYGDMGAYVRTYVRPGDLDGRVISGASLTIAGLAMALDEGARTCAEGWRDHFVGKAAPRRLGINRTTLYNRMESWHRS